MKRYGTPYKGSKNSIAEWVVEHIPPAGHFYDLFAGGCAVTHAALESGKYRAYHANDITDSVILFDNAIHGKYSNEKRWISREDFFRLKDTDAYVRYLWSFGNNVEGYLYSKVVEPWKKALHYARVLGDFSILHEFGIDTNDASRICIKKHEEEYKQKYIIWYCKEVLHSDLDELTLQKNLNERIECNSEALRAYLCEGLKKSGKSRADVDRFLGTNGMAGHYFGKSQWEFPTMEVYTKLQGFLDLPTPYAEIYGLQELLESLESLERLQSLQSMQILESLESLERLQRLQRLQILQSLQRLEITQGDFRNVTIVPDSVIYCDIPYKGTEGYNGADFNHDEFYSWAEKQEALVIISEYDAPADRFICIAEKEKVQLLSGKGSGKKIKERLFIPKSQIGLYRQKSQRKYIQLELFAA